MARAVAARSSACSVVSMPLRMGRGIAATISIMISPLILIGLT